MADVDQWNDPVGNVRVVGVVGVVGLNADDAVPDGHVFDDRLLKERRIKSWRVVVDVAHVDQQLSRVGSARITAVLSSDDQPVAADRFEIERLHNSHVTAQRVDDEVALRVAANQRIA